MDEQKAKEIAQAIETLESQQQQQQQQIQTPPGPNKGTSYDRLLQQLYKDYETLTGERYECVRTSNGSFIKTSSAREKPRLQS